LEKGEVEMNRKRNIEVWASMTDLLLLLVIVGFAVIMVITQSKIANAQAAAKAENSAAQAENSAAQAEKSAVEGQLREAIKTSSGLKTNLESSQAQLSVCGSELEKALAERKRYEAIADDRAKSCLARGNAELEKVIDQVEQALKALSAKFPGELSADSKSVSLSSEILTYSTNGHRVDSRNPKLDQFIDALCASLDGLELPEQALIV
jgi:molecular chaperone GrpE (heat shock protein)